MYTCQANTNSEKNKKGYTANAVKDFKSKVELLANKCYFRIENFE